MDNAKKSSSHAVFNLKLHIVLVTKYRRKTLLPEVLDYLREPLFWHRAYFVGSVGGANLETVRAYVDAQGTEEHAGVTLELAVELAQRAELVLGEEAFSREDHVQHRRRVALAEDPKEFRGRP